MEALPRSVLTTERAASKPLSLRSLMVCSSSESLADVASAAVFRCSRRTPLFATSDRRRSIEVATTAWDFV